jgi:hypothetical protein
MFYIYAGNELVYQTGNENYKAISPKLTVEFGKAGSLEFSMPSVNPVYNSLNQLKTILIVQQDNNEIFRGRVLSNKLNLYNTRDIYAEGDLAYLVDSVQKAEKYSGKAKTLFKSIIDKHNQMVGDAAKQFTVGNITVDDRDVYLAGKSEDITDKETNNFNYRQIALNSIAEEWQTTFDYIEKCLIEYCGGYLRTRHVNGKTYIDWVKDYTSTATQTIEVGRNVLDFSEEVNVEDLFTVLIPLGDDNLTVEKAAAYNQNGIIHNAGSSEIVNTAAVQKYGRIIKTNVFDSVTSSATLLENGVRFLQTNSDLSETFTITAVDLHNIDSNIQSISLGDKVQIISAPHGINNTSLTCTKIEYDLANPANTVYTFGKPKQTLTERYRKDKKEQAESAGRGGGGGGGGAAAAAEDKADKNVKEIFDAWITCDKDKALVDIGALYKKLHGSEQIINEVGMKMSGQDATVNIYADHVQRQNDREILKNNLGINLDAIAGTINLFADHTELNKNTSVLTNNLGINLDAPAGRINIFTTATDATNAKTATAEIVAWAGRDADGKLGSNIAIKADVVDINTRITNINSELTVISGKLEAFSISADSVTVNKALWASGVGANDIVANNRLFVAGTDASLHTHSFTANGGTITIGGADWTGTAHSFNIADTQYYKDGVSAARTAGVNSVTIESVARMYTVGNKVHVIARASNGATKQFDV